MGIGLRFAKAKRNLGILHDLKVFYQEAGKGFYPNNTNLARRFVGTRTQTSYY